MPRGLAELRAIGEQWGVSMALTQLAEFTELRAEHAASISALTEAAAIGRELGVWGDLTYVEARLALIHARAGDLGRGPGRASPGSSGWSAARGGRMDSDRWVALHARRAGLAGGRLRRRRPVLPRRSWPLLGDAQARWWQSLRAQVKARLAAALLRQGDPARCRALLARRLTRPGPGREHPALAAVLDACAAYLLAERGGRATRAGRAAARRGRTPSAARSTSPASTPPPRASGPAAPSARTRSTAPTRPRAAPAMPPPSPAPVRPSPAGRRSRSG